MFDLYDTLVHAHPDGSFFREVPAALGVDGPGRLARRLHPNPTNYY
jgi:hypothetical protein